MNCYYLHAFYVNCIYIVCMIYTRPRAFAILCIDRAPRYIGGYVILQSIDNNVYI